MHVFRTTYKDKRGQTKKAAKWYIEFRDHLDTVRRLPGFESKAATEELGRNLDKLVAFYKSSGGQTDPTLTRFLTGLPDRKIAKLVAIGLLAPSRVATSKTLADHLEDFAAALTAKGNTVRHVELVKSRTHRLLIVGCRFSRPADISATRVQDSLKDLQDKGRGLRTVNFYMKAAKQFIRWLVRERRLVENPLIHLTTLNAETEVRHGRRALSVNELRLILTSALGSKVNFRGLTGQDRHYLYLTAMSTGLRVSELASLTPGSFDLKGDRPTVTVMAAYTKNRKMAVQPLPDDVATALAVYLRAKSQSQLVWPGTWIEKAAKMLRIDLEAAKVPYVTEGPNGREFADFHSLRHSYVSLVVASGATVKVAQSLARHATVTLTLGRYAHIGLHDGAAAVDAMPKLLPTEVENTRLRATGTTGGSDLASSLALSGRFAETGEDCGGQAPDKSDLCLSVEMTREKAGKPLIFQSNTADQMNYARRDSNPQPTVPKTVALSN